MQNFVDEFAPAEDTEILDVGGTPFNWQLIGASYPITMVNLTAPPDADALPPNLRPVVGSGTQLDFEDQAYDIAFSNSVIEHVGDWDAQKAFAAEIRRVSNGLWVQTPAREFPVEPHLLAPFIHWLPVKWQRRLVRRFTGWGLVTKPSQQRIDDMIEELQLLNRAQMEELFPDCEIRREGFLGLTKAYIAVRPAH